MARNPKSAKAVQLFRGGRNDIQKNPWVQNLGFGCCDPSPVVDVDRLNPTINPENALVHSRPFGNRLHWRFSEHDDTTRANIVAHINRIGVGAQLEVLVIPTFAFWHSLHVVTLAEEAGLTFNLRTRNGTVIPTSQTIRVTETDSGNGCGEVARVQTNAASPSGIGGLSGATRVHNIFVDGNGGQFALEADVLILEVAALPASGG